MLIGRRTPRRILITLKVCLMWREPNFLRSMHINIGFIMQMFRNPILAKPKNALQQNHF